VYKRTDNKLLSIAVALLYISTLNLCMLWGFCLLMSTWESFMLPVLHFFKAPYIFGIFVVTVALHFWLILPLQQLSVEKKKPRSITPILFYSAASLLVFIYSQVADKIFAP
jgi:hypothetical protein